MAPEGVQIDAVREEDLEELLPLVRAYCDFYAVAPPDRPLLTMCRALLENPDHEGVQLIARVPGGRAVGFATIFWTWSTLSAARIGIMNDLYVASDARGGGVAEALISACRERCRELGARWLSWQTAKDNVRAQRVYERVGARREEWVDYSLEVT
ncbi:MAG: GNAT family N-acetyltransferase [Thermoleophilaceae bacterium]